jgi:uncharacterized protein (DUF2336 family)
MEVMSSKSAALQANLLDELQNALSDGPVARRVETLRRVTDLFLHGADRYSDDQIAVFDDVFNCLIERIETSAKALLANRLAPIPKAPPHLIHTLAFDDVIEVAAPVLSHSERLDDAALIENARVKSQGHLLAISKRKVLSGAVTDVLVERGNDEVLESTVNNPGARFSEDGFTRLVARAEGDDNLTTCLGMRVIPRHHYLALIARASASVRARLEAVSPQSSGDIAEAVAQVTGRARRAAAAMEEKAVIAHGLIKSLYDEGRLDEAQIAAFAEAGKIHETNAAIAALANVSVEIVENMMMSDSRSEGLMILAKVCGLSWTTLTQVMAMQDGVLDADAEEMNEFKRSYEMLRLATAQQVLRFHKMRQTAVPAEPATA